MTQKKFFQLAGIIVIAVWVFCITFAIAYKVQTRTPDKNVPATNPPATTTTNPYQGTGAPLTGLLSPSQPSTNSIFGVSPAPSGNQGLTSPSLPAATQPVTQPTTQAGVTPQGKGEIINAYVNGVNQLKNTQSFSMYQNDTLNVTITDVKMVGGDIFKNGVMAFANNLIAPPEPESYTFISGVDAITGKTPNEVIAPLNTAAQVDFNAVTNATSAPTADGGYTVELTIQPEEQTLYSPAPNLSTMVEVIDMTSRLPANATLTEMNISYAPTTITATFDSQNRITSMEHKLASKGGGAGKMIVEVTMQMEGNYTSNYTFTYN